MRKKIVCLGGGTGVSVVLSGLKKYPLDLMAILTMFDNGGSTGKLREELGLLPVGDIRQCLIATADNNSLTNLFRYRFGEGALKGHNLGNLLIVAGERMTGSLEGAIDKLGMILNTKCKIYPVTLTDAHVKAVLKDNRKVDDEEEIIHCQDISRVGIKKLYLAPKARANPKAILAIKKADLIIVGPGKFYTSILPNLLVEGMVKAIRQSRAKKIFIANLMTQVGNTDNFQVEDFLKVLEQYLGKNTIDYVIFNTGRLSPDLEKEVGKVFPGASFINYSQDLLQKKNFIGADILDHNIQKPDPADVMARGANQRTMVLHDPDKLAKTILKLCKPR